MNTLPLELIVEIFIRLPYPIIIELALVSKEFQRTSIYSLSCLTIPKFTIDGNKNYNFLIKYRPKIKTLKIDLEYCLGYDKMNLTKIRYEKIFLGVNIMLYFPEKFLKNIQINLWKFVVCNNSHYIYLLDLCRKFESLIVRTLVIDIDTYVDFLLIDITKIRFTRLKLYNYPVHDSEIQKNLDIAWSNISSFKMSNNLDYEFLLKTKCKIKTLIIDTIFVDVETLDISEINYENLHLIRNCDNGFIHDIRTMDSIISDKCKKLTLCVTANFSDIFVNSLTHLKLCTSVKFKSPIDDFYFNIEKFILVLPKLRKLVLKKIKLNITDLKILSGYEHIVLNRVNMPVNWDHESLRCNSQVNLKLCRMSDNDWLFNGVLYGNKL